MIQEIIVYLIITIAFGMLVLSMLRFFNLVGKKEVNSSKCGGCSTSCEMKELHQISKIRKYDQYKLYL